MCILVKKIGSPFKALLVEDTVEYQLSADFQRKRVLGANVHQFRGGRGLHTQSITMSHRPVPVGTGGTAETLSIFRLCLLPRLPEAAKCHHPPSFHVTSVICACMTYYRKLFNRD